MYVGVRDQHQRGQTGSEYVGGRGRESARGVAREQGERRERGEQGAPEQDRGPLVAAAARPTIPSERRIAAETNRSTQARTASRCRIAMRGLGAGSVSVRGPPGPLVDRRLEPNTRLTTPSDTN